MILNESIINLIDDLRTIDEVTVNYPKRCEEFSNDEIFIKIRDLELSISKADIAGNNYWNRRIDMTTVSSFDISKMIELTNGKDIKKYSKRREYTVKNSKLYCILSMRERCEEIIGNEVPPYTEMITTYEVEGYDNIIGLIEKNLSKTEFNDELAISSTGSYSFFDEDCSFF